jgi:hypothetical protein
MQRCGSRRSGRLACSRAPGAVGFVPQVLPRASAFCDDGWVSVSDRPGSGRRPLLAGMGRQAAAGGQERPVGTRDPGPDVREGPRQIGTNRFFTISSKIRDILLITPKTLGQHSRSGLTRSITVVKTCLNLMDSPRSGARYRVLAESPLPRGLRQDRRDPTGGKHTTGR